MLNFKFITPVLFFCLTNIFAHVSHQEAMESIICIADRASFEKLIHYLSHEKSDEIIHVKLAMQERKKSLEKWRDGYYTNYSLFWLTMHLTGDVIIGGVSACWIGGISYLVTGSSDNAKIGVAVGGGIGGLLACKNIIGYFAGKVSSMQYKVENVDLQISRLENLLAIHN